MSLEAQVLHPGPDHYLDQGLDANELRVHPIGRFLSEPVNGYKFTMNNVGVSRKKRTKVSAIQTLGAHGKKGGAGALVYLKTGEMKYLLDSGNPKM